MNRMYMLLTLNNHGNQNRSYSHASIHIDFKAGVFFNRNEIKEYDIENEQIFYDIFKGKKDLLTCSTILSDNDKIKVKFFSGMDARGNITIKMEDLLF